MQKTTPTAGWTRQEIALLAAITLLAALLRFPGLGSLPPGLYRDEAFNGLDALSVLAGARPIFFEANNGREPLFIYLVAASVAWLGRTALAVRVVSAVLGTLTVPAAYLMARAWFDRRTALLTAVIAAIAVWSITLSRMGFRAVSMPLFVALTVWQLGRAFSTCRTRHFAAAGLFLGLTFYTYLAARFVPLALAAFVAVVWLARRPVSWRGLALTAGVALLVAVPLLAYGVTHAGDFMARGFQVSVLNPAINGGDPAGTLVRHAWRTLLMFTTRGDFIPRHNVPLRPVFDPLLGLAFVLGLGAGLARWREPGRALVLVWTGVMLLPTVLAEGAPHFLRAAGVLPVLFVVPALGLVWAAGQAERWLPALAAHRRLLPAAAGLVLAAALASSVHDYFWVHARSDAVYYEYETGAVELANQVNDFTTEQPAGRVYLARRLWDGWPTVRFLVPESPRLVRIDSARPPGASAAAPSLLVVWPFDDNRRALRLLPRGAEIRAAEGALERGDLEPEPRRLFVTYQALPGAAQPAGTGASFGSVARLLDSTLQPAGRDLRVRLIWEAVEASDLDYTVFVHVLGPAGPVGQSDARPAGGLYPTPVWRPGDRVVDEHSVALPAPFDPATQRVVVGLYRLETGERVPVLGPGGAAVADQVEVSP